MADQELVNYVKNRLSNGDSKEEIIKVLIDAGWEQVEIDDAFLEIKDEGTYAVEEEKPKAKRKGHPFHFRKLAMILVIILVIAFCFLLLSGTAQT